MKNFLLLLMVVVLAGCTKTVTTAQLDAEERAQDGNTFPNRAYYVGSEHGYDYFVIRGVGGSAWRRISESEGAVAVTNRFTVTKDEKRWRGIGKTGWFVIVTNGVVSGADGSNHLIISNVPTATPQ